MIEYSLWTGGLRVSALSLAVTGVLVSGGAGGGVGGGGGG